MKRDAEAHAAEDKKRREVIDLKNQGENLVYQTEKRSRSTATRSRPTCAATSRARSTASRKPLKSDDADRIKKTMENLKQASYKLAEEMYKAAGRAAAARAAGRPGAGSADRPRHDRGEQKKDDDVIDAEYEVKK